MSDNIPIDAIETSLHLIEALRRYESVTLTELANETDINKSTAFNHLETLERNEYVVKEGNNYRISCRFLELGARARDYHEVYHSAREEIKRLSAETGEISALLTEEHGYGTFLHREEDANAVQIDSYVGQRIYLHGAALGKAILASLPREEVDEIIDQRGLPAITSNTITERDQLYAELDQINERGVALDDQERLNGLRSVATPLTDGNGNVLGSLSIAGPVSRIQGERFREEFPKKVIF
jgi:DNA-binding IclR family transcriptional regulator